MSPVELVQSLSMMLLLTKSLHFNLYIFFRSARRARRPQARGRRVEPRLDINPLTLGRDGPVTPS